MYRLSRTSLFVSLLLASTAPAVAQASDAPAVSPTASPVTLEWNTRLRHEAVDDAAFARDADATTLRLRLGARFRWGENWSALVEGEGIGALDDHYNSGANGQVAYPVIADPEGAELNQAWIGWRNPQVGVTIGRQRLLIDNQRWVGNVGWRQNEQTFDAAALEWRPNAAITARYAWLDRVHRINGDDARDPLARERDLDSHVLDVGYARGRQQFGGYVLAHDDHDVAQASSITTGIRWSGNYVDDGQGWGWRVEAARQREYGANPLHFSHAYWLLEPSVTLHGMNVRAGWEHLGGDGQHALQAPLATLHGFNGWADKFLVTPATGLDDRYVAVAGDFGNGERASKMKWMLAWHDYVADNGGDMGREWDASLGFPLAGKLAGLVKLADYRSRGFAQDTTKLWVQLEWTH